MAGIKSRSIDEETLRERILAQSIEVYQRKEEVVGAEMMRHFEKGDAANARFSGKKASGGDGLPASGYSSARLCAKRSEAGIQARILRYVRRDAGIAEIA